jgi:hypothetical protein
MADRRDSADRSSGPRLFIRTAMITIVLEIITCVTRFALQMESTRDTASTIGRLTGGLRIHHSYPGLVLIGISSWIWERYPRLAFWLFPIGVGLLLSDLIHHFLVLWLVTGHPQFDLFYP